MNPLVFVVRVGALLGAGALVIGLFVDEGAPWFTAHGTILLVGTILPAILYFHGLTFARFTTAPASRLVTIQARLLLVASSLALPFTLLTGWLAATAGAMMLAILLAVAIVSMRIYRECKPTGSVVNLDKDALTKGDDACFKHIKMAHMFLPMGLLIMLAAALTAPVSGLWSLRLWLSGIHVLLIGFLLLSLYGIGHLWVPRFSGVPAIAVGAIKGELHSSMPALILLPIGFLTGWAGFIIAGGAFAFLGFFTYMGVLGANIMRNKSVTHRVTPEFVYIPWTFAGIFWLVSGVLMGISLAAVPEVMADRAGALRGVHIHINLLGGVVQLLLAWLIPMAAIQPVFSGTMKSAFYGFNVAVAIAVGNMLAGGEAVWYVAAMVLCSFALLAFMKATGGFMKARQSVGN